MKPLLINFPLGHLANDWAPASIWILAPAIAMSMGLSPSEMGLLIAIQAMGASLGYLPAGILADRVSKQGRLLIYTFWWVAVGHLLASMAPGFWSLAIMIAIAGMGDAAWHPIATGILVKQMPERKGMVLGIHAMGGTLAEVGSPLVVGLLLGYFDWRTTLQFSVVPAVLMGLVFCFYAKHIPVSTVQKVSKFELGQIVKHWLKPKGLALVGMISLYNMALIALMSMSALFMQSQLQYSPAYAGIMFAAAMLLGSILQPVLGRYSDVVDRHLVFIVGSLLAICCGAIATLSGNNVIVVTALIFNMGLLVSVRSGILASAVEYARTRAATTMGFVFVLLDGVGALGAVLAGFVAEYQLRYVFALAAILSLLSVILSISLHRRQADSLPLESA